MQLTADEILHNEVRKKFLKAQTVLDLDRKKTIACHILP